MLRVAKLLYLMTMIVFSASFALAGTITGTVKGPDGAPFMGAFVQAQNAKTRITVNVLSDRNGKYRVDNLPAGEYSLRVRAVGYNGGNALRGVAVAASQNLSQDFALQPGMVRWQDISYWQAEKLLPERPGKAKLMSRCFVCHSFQNRMASTRKDEDGWRTSVNFMKTTMGVAGPRFTEQDSENVVQYLAALFSDNSILPKSPTEMPNWKEAAQPPFTEDSMKIVYVEYDMPGPGRMPFSATPDKNGILWIPMAGNANKLGRLDPETGAIEEFPIPTQNRSAQVHSAAPAADGTVWIGESSLRTLGKWDPATRKITDFKNESGGGAHTVLLDQKGTPWLSPGPGARGLMSRFDPETNKFVSFPGSEQGYGLTFDKDGNCWFVQFVKDGQLGKVDAKTGKVSKWPLPTADSRPRRIDIDKDGNIWMNEFQAGKIARFDPKTETFKEWELPGSAPGPYPDDENGPYAIGSQPGPYAFALDHDGNAWYSGTSTDTIGRLDPKTGKVTVYPFPHAEITMREFFMDAKENIWWGSSGNNKVGYFYLAK